MKPAPATKVGTSWQVETLPDSPRHSRPLSTRSRQMLVHALQYRTLREQCRVPIARGPLRIRALRATDDPAPAVGLVGRQPTTTAACSRPNSSPTQQRATQTTFGTPSVSIVTNICAIPMGSPTCPGTHDPGLVGASTRRHRRHRPCRRPADRKGRPAPLRAVRRTLRALDVEPTALPDLQATPTRYLEAWLDNRHVGRFIIDADATVFRYDEDAPETPAIAVTTT